MIKNVIFDMGNVLLHYDPEVVLNHYCKTETSKDIIRKELFEGPEWIMGDRGILKNAERYEPVSKRVPKEYHEELKNCIDGWHICLEPVAGGKEFCLSLKEKGYHIYILSNADNTFHDFFPRFGQEEWFDGVVVSSDIKMIKPEPYIYQYILTHYQLNPEECFFIDDREDNVAAARDAGIDSYVFTGNYEELKTKFELA